MPRAARTTKKRISSSSEEESTDVETTPKQKKTTVNNARLKRRVSGFQLDEADDGEQSIPLKSFNEELAEKRSLKRRKSSRMTMAFDPDAGSQENQEPEQDAYGSAEAPNPPKKSALARANQLKSVVAPGPMVPVPLEIMTSNFEEWMKMATDNKINANNSWSFALIDYFHDMSLLRNDGDNSINFQKASRTLDGCVKIWTSRVDSVGTDTGKLLSNLATEGKIISEDAENEEGADGADGAKKRKASRQEATLAKNPAQLQTKKLDLEFTIDPLFKKTSGDFDEGGAQGLLMNHLGVDSGIRVIFDAMDTPGGAENEEEDKEVVSLQVPLADLRAKLDYPSLSYRSLQSERLSNFKFSAAADATSTKYSGKDEELDSEDEAAFQNPPDVTGDAMDVVNEENNASPEEPQDFFAGDEGGVGDAGDYGGYGGDDNEGDYGDANEDRSGMHDGEEGQQSGVHPMGHAMFDPRKPPDQRELVMAMNQDGGASMLDYFDSNVTRNWAGPEHWKLRKVIRKPDKAEQSTAPKQRKEKEPFSIDFSEQLPADFEKKLFEPPVKGSLTLPAKQCAYIGGKKKKNLEKRESFLLPEDMHFSSKQLLSLFLKPKFVINFRGHRTWLRPDNDEEIDENFWAKAAADAALPPDDDNLNLEGAGMPFATQYFNDDDDDDGGGGFDDAYGGGDGMAGAGLDESADLLAATQGQVRRVRPEFVNYAKKVKRVDVRKLKENIWKGLDIVLSDEEEEERPTSHSPQRKPTDPSEAKKFTSVISELRKSYPKDKMEEISTSFCFICLLHLANERGLKIEGEDDNGLGAKMSGLRLSNSARRMMEEDDPDIDDEVVKDDSAKIGDIWGLRIYRDPDAIPSA
ncbi:hypothetical protein FRC14_003419 [Serendipita sp. 396]|nr:hypothetical protein FRC14_003419 [Serendipita sp. 396]